jgi:hypothetical protein
MKYQGLFCGLFVLSLAAFAPAQEVKTVFAQKLHATIPGDVSAGGVAWAKDSLGLPRAWSGEADGTRSEVAEESPMADAAAQQARLLEILPGAELKAVKVSGSSAWEGTTSGATILGVPLKSGFWIVLSKGPAAQSVTDSVCIERDGPAGFMPRTIPGGLNMVLPYNVSPRRGRPGWEMKFDGFELDLRTDRAGEGMKLDIKKSMDDEVNGFKNNKAYTDVKVDRDRMRDLGDGEMAVIKYKEGGKAHEKISLMGINAGTGIQLSWTFDPARKEHRDISNRMVNTFKKTGEMVVEGERFECDNTGFSFETPLNMKREEKGDMTEWTGDNGGMIVTARHLYMTRETDQSGAAALFPDVVKGQMNNPAGFKSQTVPYVVNGVDGLLVKTEWNGAARYGLFLGTFEGTFVLDVLSLNKAEVEQAIRSVQISIAKPVDPLKKFTFKDSTLSVLSLDGATQQADKGDKPYKSIEIVQLNSAGEGVFQSVMHTLEDDDALVSDLPGVIKSYAESFAAATKGKLKILNQGWQSDSVGADYWMAFELEASGQKFQCTMTAVSSGKSLLLQTSLLLSSDNSVRGMAQVIMNSYRPAMP